MKKIIFSPINSLFTAAALLACSAPVFAELPTFPLNDEFTTSSNETVSSTGQNWTQHVINSTGVWNIVGEMAQVNWNYEGWHRNFLKGDGTINLGSDTQGGSLYIMGSNPVAEEVYENWFNFAGTINVARKGQFTLGGSYNSHYGSIFSIGTLNINGGIVSIMSETENNSYFCVNNLSIRDGGLFESVLNLQTGGSGVWDLYSQGVSSSLLRVSSGNFTLNLHSENVLNQLPRISFDENTGTNFRINAFADNSIGDELEFNGNAVLELSVADGATLTIKTLATKSDAHAVQNAEIIFYDYRADAVLFEDPYIFVEDDRLCLSAYETYVKLTAYDGEGNLLQGVWTYEWDDAAGIGKLVLAAVPEPAAIAAVFGALALALAARRKRK